MKQNQNIVLEYSYLKLPKIFYEYETIEKFSNPEVIILNQKLIESLSFPINKNNDFLNFILPNQLNINSFSQAYAGHQFGHFTKLGDGRAIILGEYMNHKQERVDIQLKGCGKTTYSRGGDGKATLKAMLREFLISEAMYFLNIPTSRSMGVIKTGDYIQREKTHKGAVLTRLMTSHIRVGTFEYARHFGTIKDLQSLTEYTIKRHYPAIENVENPGLELLKKVINVQIELVINWMRVGFIHGVMNTDNTSICGETFDYGPCAFMNIYNPKTVYSSIDTNARYAFGNQPLIIKWNITRFAESLLPIINSNINVAIDQAQSIINEFDSIWNLKYYQMMINKIGIETYNPNLHFLIDELLSLMQKHQLDYTNTFGALSQEIISEDNIFNQSELKIWYKKWKNTIESITNFKKATEIMKRNNPEIIPRNHIVENALDYAIEGKMEYFEELYHVLQNPYKFNNFLNQFKELPSLEFEKSYHTYCGT
jgi:uncharacterized protein YdiU (UPF0061 family)